MMETTQGRRLKCQPNIGDILLAGEHLRVRMHTDNPHLIKDRRHHFRSHTCCFTGRETVDWLVETKQAPDRDAAVVLMNILLENDIIHHVGCIPTSVNKAFERDLYKVVRPWGGALTVGCIPTSVNKAFERDLYVQSSRTEVTDECAFKDDNLFYRFRKDDGTFPWHESVTLFLKGLRLFNRLFADPQTVMRIQEEGGVHYPNSFQGCHLLDWLLANGDFSTREEAIAECRRMLENDVIRHVSDSHHFKDEPLLYLFKTDYSRKPQLVNLLLRDQPPANDGVDGQAMVKSHAMNGTRTVAVNGAGAAPSSPTDNGTVQRPSPSSSASGTSPPQSNKALDIPREKRPQRTESGYHSYPEDELGAGSPQFGSPSFLNSQPHSTASLTGMVFRKATIEELEAPNSPYIKKHIRIASDPVGFGFVVRGEGPSYIQTVDPTGPAAQAGLKVGHYVIKVNDQRVTSMDHRQLAHVILDHMGYLRLVVMEHVQK